MKKLFILLGIIAIVIYLFQQRREASLNPEDIAHPIYAEIHGNMVAQGRNFEQVFFAKTVNDADCKKYSTALVEDMQKAQASVTAIQWALKSSECKSELPPRHARLFDNAQSFVTYISLARGSRLERETRVIYWGVSPEESDRICAGVPMMQKGRKGVVTCVHAVAL